MSYNHKAFILVLFVMLLTVIGISMASFKSPLENIHNTYNTNITRLLDSEY